MKPKTKCPDANAEQREKFKAAAREKFEELIAIADKIRRNPNADGWMRLCEILGEAEADKRIQSSPGALGFLKVVHYIAADSFVYDDAIQAFRLLTPMLASDQLRDNTGRIKGGDTMRRSAETHVEHLKDAVIDLLKNRSTSDWSDPEIARWLMKPERAFHERKGKAPLGLRTMTARVKKIRADYKASI